ncbi:hypothetical protein B0I35DRAFT_417357, partial [Stachybotrys elegans]
MTVRLASLVSWRVVVLGSIKCRQQVSKTKQGVPSVKWASKGRDSLDETDDRRPLACPKHEACMCSLSNQAKPVMLHHHNQPEEDEWMQHRGN